MPHVICEYSANLEEKIRLDALLETLHSAMMRTRVAELAGLRTRAARRDHFRVADHDPAHGFLNVTIRAAKGRESAPPQAGGRDGFRGGLEASRRGVRHDAARALGRGAGDQSRIPPPHQQYPHLDEDARAGRVGASLFRLPGEATGRT